MDYDISGAYGNTFPKGKGWKSICFRGNYKVLEIRTDPEKFDLSHGSIITANVGGMDYEYRVEYNNYPGGYAFARRLGLAQS